MHSRSSSRRLYALENGNRKTTVTGKRVCSSRACFPFLSSLLLLIFCSLLAPPGSAIGQTRDVVVAVVDGRAITERQLDDSVVAKVFQLQQQLYALRKVALDNLISRMVMENEAARKHVSVEDLKEQMLGGRVTVSPEKVEELYTENAAVFALMSPDEAKAKLRLDLETQARLQRYRDELAKLRAAAKIQLLLEEPSLPIPEANVVASLGPKNAQVVMTEFSDFQCPYCRSVQPVLKEILRQYPNQVRLDFKHFPLEQHPLAELAAQAAFCAAQQGAFWRYHDVLLATTELSRQFLDATAINLGLNPNLFKSCLASPESRMAVLADVQEAKRLGINSTPTFLINGRLLRGAVGLEQFKSAIDRELRASQTGSHGQQP